MKRGFFARLALDGMRKNKRLYVPYLLTCIGMVMMYYIVTFLRFDPLVQALRGYTTMSLYLFMGSGIMLIFSGFFLLYTSSFLLQRRKKEFGLYNVLGMEKKGIYRIVLWENLISYGVALVGGLTLGIAFSKVAELGLINIAKEKVSFSFRVAPQGVIRTIIGFFVLFFLLYIRTVLQVRKTQTVNLVKSENFGETAPKANWFLTLLGVVCLAVAYTIALSVKDPISAAMLFFFAVSLVIFGTQSIMVSGSVFFCRMMQKNKKYYYKSKHFISLSSMTFRMKRNGSGLASICILITMVLVMISSTSSLYIGEEDCLNFRYPRDVQISYNYVDLSFSERASKEMDKTKNLLSENRVTTENALETEYAFVWAKLNNGILDLDQEHRLDGGRTSEQFSFYVYPVSFYNRVTGENVSVSDGEVLAEVYGIKMDDSVLRFYNGQEVTFTKLGTKFNEKMGIASETETAILLFADDIKALTLKLISDDNPRLFHYYFYYAFDTDATPERLEEVFAGTSGELTDENGEYHVPRRMEWKSDGRDDFYGMYGGLFFLGIILSIAFLFATFLIVYYKQISEGYEDQSRFEIMQKVGLQKKDIRRSIDSQLLVVFFLPILMAGVHLAFAFPIIRKLLMLFDMYNTKLFATACVVCYVVFSVFYAIVYRMTSKAYFNIVSGAKEE